ncbi:MAG: dephospho-CoA kinase [Clostridia bacterium]|nr:dephospho-CoA kinase [Clostridia bacterium]
MKIVGISGGSGAGKSTVSRGLAKILPNAVFIDVDPFFREATDKLEGEIFKAIKMVKEEGVLNQNYFFSSLEAMNAWINVIKDYVSCRIEETVAKLGEENDYIIVDWCYLPMCSYFEKCDYTLCVKADYHTRFKRLSDRMKAVNGYSIASGPSFYEYQKEPFENRVKYSAIDEYGYSSQFEIVNDRDIESLNKSVKMIAEGIVSLDSRKKIISTRINNGMMPKFNSTLIQNPIIQSRGSGHIITPSQRNVAGQYVEYNR